MSLRIDCCCNLYTGLLSYNEIAGDLTREEKKNYDGKCTEARDAEQSNGKDGGSKCPARICV